MKRFFLPLIFLFPVVMLLAWVYWGYKQNPRNLPRATDEPAVTNVTNAATNLSAPAKP